MKRVLCCNYLLELEELITEGKVNVDYIKFPSINIDNNALENALELKPIIFHGFAPMEGCMSSPNFKCELSLNEFRHYVGLTKTPYISGHIAARGEHYPNYNENDNTQYEQILSTTIYNVNYIKNNFDLPLLLENLMFSPQIDMLKCVSEPDFLCRAVYETNSYFLLDTSHARLSAYYRNIPFEEYISKLPLDRIYEIHLSGVAKHSDGNLSSSHIKMNKEDYEILEYLLENTPVKVVTLEYGDTNIANYNNIHPTIKNELYEQIVRIEAIMSKY